MGVELNIVIDNSEIENRIARTYAKQYGIEIDPHTGGCRGRTDQMCRWVECVIDECRRVCRGEDRFE